MALKLIENHNDFYMQLLLQQVFKQKIFNIIRV